MKKLPIALIVFFLLGLGSAAFADILLPGTPIPDNYLYKEITERC